MLRTGAVDAAIWGISLRSSAVRDALAVDDFVYHVVERTVRSAARAAAHESTRAIGSLLGIAVAAEDVEAALARLTDPAVTVVTITVTEHGYCAVGPGGALDLARAEIVHDLVEPARSRARCPGLLVEALVRRRAAGVAPFTVASCDNLPSNGGASRGWSATSPSAATRARRVGRRQRRLPVVDGRPDGAVDHRRRSSALPRGGTADAWPIVTEPFSQWVLEDNFPGGRPDLGASRRRAGRATSPCTSRPSCGSSTPRTRRSRTGACSPATASSGRRPPTRSLLAATRELLEREVIPTLADARPDGTCALRRRGARPLRQPGAAVHHGQGRRRRLAEAARAADADGPSTARQPAVPPPVRAGAGGVGRNCASVPAPRVRSSPTPHSPADRRGDMRRRAARPRAGRGGRGARSRCPGFLRRGSTARSQRSSSSRRGGCGATASTTCSRARHPHSPHSTRKEHRERHHHAAERPPGDPRRRHRRRGQCSRRSPTRSWRLACRSPRSRSAPTAADAAVRVARRARRSRRRCRQRPHRRSGGPAVGAPAPGSSSAPGSALRSSNVAERSACRCCPVSRRRRRSCTRSTSASTSSSCSRPACSAGPAAVRDLGAPFPSVRFVPTGGVGAGEPRRVPGDSRPCSRSVAAGWSARDLLRAGHFDEIRHLAGRRPSRTRREQTDDQPTTRGASGARSAATTSCRSAR